MPRKHSTVEVPPRKDIYADRERLRHAACVYTRLGSEFYRATQNSPKEGIDFGPALAVIRELLQQPTDSKDLTDIGVTPIRISGEDITRMRDFVGLHDDYDRMGPHGIADKLWAAYVACRQLGMTLNATPYPELHVPPVR